MANASEERTVEVRLTTWSISSLNMNTNIRVCVVGSSVLLWEKEKHRECLKKIFNLERPFLFRKGKRRLPWIRRIQLTQCSGIEPLNSRWWIARIFVCAWKRDGREYGALISVLIENQSTTLLNTRQRMYENATRPPSTPRVFLWQINWLN